jgi:hypothetical protein
VSLLVVVVRRLLIDRNGCDACFFGARFSRTALAQHELWWWQQSRAQRNRGSGWLPGWREAKL